MSKLIFFDIDGTLLDSDMHVPESTIEGLRQARANGHKTAICTGRPYTIIYPFLLDLGFDGVVASAGAYIRCGQETIYHSILEKEKLNQLCGCFDLHGAAYFLQGYSGCFLTKRNRERMEETLSGGKSADKIRSDMTICEDPVHAGILECGVYFRADATVAELQDEMDQLTDGYFKLTGCSFGTDIVYSGEFTRKGVNKATGMQHMMDAMGISREDTIAFGDGSNDFEMIDYAGQGIVMGNGIPALKEHADYVTTDIHQEGIWNGLKQVGVI